MLYIQLIDIVSFIVCLNITANITGINVTDTVNSQTNNKAEHFEPLPKSTQNETSVDELTNEETREILTPLAFNIDKSLFGMALAVPWRRGAALTVDLFLVALLSEVPGELLALLVAVTLFNVGSKKRAKKSGKTNTIRRTTLRLVAACIVFVVLIDVLPQLFSKLETFNNNVEQANKSEGVSSGNNNEINQNSTSNDFIKVTLSLAANLAVSHSECVKFSCWQELSQDLALGYLEQSTSKQEAEQFNVSLLENIADKSTLTEQEIATIKAKLQALNDNNSVEQVLKEQQLLSTSDNSSDEISEVDHKASVTENASQRLVNNAVQESAKEEKSEQDKSLQKANDTERESSEPVMPEPVNPKVYKGLAWLKGLVEDLGLGFGWAAFYFTMFTALWYGQTPGKKLFNIRVIQLDGTPLSVWDSFGRYGGYGAGIATGLLGFAQIFWDPNRQAIHDKISSTIVINDKGFGRKKYKQNITEKA